MQFYYEKKNKFYSIYYSYSSFCFFLIDKSEKEYERNECIGTYKIDIENSDFNKNFTDSNKFSNLKLSINEDNTFSFSENVPFIYGKKGTWTTITIDGEFVYCIFEYDKSKFKEEFLCKGFMLSKEKPIPRDKNLSIKGLKMKKIEW